SIINKFCEEGAERTGTIFTCKTLFTHITRVNKSICSCSVGNTMQKYNDARGAKKRRLLNSQQSSINKSSIDN
ncbi:MAG: hypothetical protein K6D59_10460, partial [Bacteroidales bacterium]|nr:hypothetical protein [Bacteroidales bacterium]